jgi:hypothetical protein
LKGRSITNHFCDVLVAGGGVSGVSAAVAAARAGAKTVLVEKENYLGGAGYAGLFQYICGLYLNSNAAPIETLNGGIARGIAAKLNKLSPQRTVKKIGQVFVLPYSKENLRSVLISLCSQESNLTIFYDATVASVKKKNMKIIEVALNAPVSKTIHPYSTDKSPHPPFTKGGQGGIKEEKIVHKITPKIVIDCTGDGDVSAMAGADFELSPLSRRQLAGFTIRLKGLKDCDKTLPVKVPYYLSQAAEQKLVPAYFKFTVFGQGESPDEGFLKINIPSENSKREQAVLKDAMKALCYLADKLPSFKDTYIIETSLKVLNREGRRISCEYILTEDDILNARKFDDAVVKNSWPIELWENNKGTVYKYIKQGDYYEIPFRCLKVKSFANLLVAGRCISVTREALGSTRVMGTCMSLGEQAGKAAAYFVKNGRYPY